MVKNRMFRFGIAVVAILLPALSSADYLYGLNKDSGDEPYVLFVADVSASMSERDAGCRPECVPNGNRCDCPEGTEDQLTRIQALRLALRSVIPKMDNVVLGMSKYGVRDSSCKEGQIGCNTCQVKLTNPLPTSSSGKPPPEEELLKAVGELNPEGDTPLGQAMAEAFSHMSAVYDADPAKECRRFAVVVLTDGGPDCPFALELRGDPTKTYANIDKLRQKGAGREIGGIPTYVIGLSNDAMKNILDEMARRGGTARTSGGWCRRGADGTCSQGTALYAKTAEELTGALQAAFQDIKRGSYTVMPPMVATVPQVLSEVDRVSNNFMVYSAFEMPNYAGKLYGVRLFQEKEDAAGEWEFTDLQGADFNLTTCGSDPDNPCVFEAGSLLQRRNTPRRIFFAKPERADTADGSIVLALEEPMPFGSDLREWKQTVGSIVQAVVASDSPLKPGVDALSEGDRGALRMLADFSSTQGGLYREVVASWIDGSSGRPSRLGDIYHSAPAIVTDPPYSYRGYGYPTFKARWRRRPPMVYVGANDGQIHAFHASDDFGNWTSEKLSPPDPDHPRWRAGEEAWSYVPFSMVAKVSLAAIRDEPRVFSQDLSCRVDDILAVNTLSGAGIDCGKDPEHGERGTCGWRTVLICGQGWGGSWYVALDITDPHDPRPLWESTHRGVGSYGLGRAWVVPSVGPVNLETEENGQKFGVPTWLAVYGSGYNTNLKDYAGNTSDAYRYLNMPFKGAYPEHGDGILGPKGNNKTEESFVFVQDVFSGKYLKRFHLTDQHGITADIPLVGTNDRFFVDTAYVGGWAAGRMDRIFFGTENGITRPGLWGYCKEILKFSESKPLTSRPSAYSNPRTPKDVYLFVGSGLDPGNDPDQQQNQGKMWEFQAFKLPETGDATCPKINSANICTSGDTLKNAFNDGSRLISPPTLAIQRNSSQWLTFTTWKPTGGCGKGTSYLYCLDVTEGAKCKPCGNMKDEDGAEDVKLELDSHKSQTPVSADERIYVIRGDGSILQITPKSGGGGGGGGGPGPPNQNAPRAMVLSWREIF